MNLIFDTTTIRTMTNAGIGVYTQNLLRELKDIELQNENFNLIEVDSKSNSIVPSVKVKKSLVKSLNNYDKPIYFSPYFLNTFPISDDFPTVITIHDFALAEFDYYSDRGFPYDLVRKKEYWYWIRKTFSSTSIVTHTNHTKEDYLRYFSGYPESHVSVVPLGLNLDESESNSFENYLPDDWKEKQYLIYMGGGIQKNKNTEGVIKAYSYFIRKLIGEGAVFEDLPYLVIAGKIFTNTDRPQSKALHKLIYELGLQEKVVFTGFYENIEKYSLLNNSFAFIHLSLYEGFGLSVVEAMRSKTPVIVDNHTTYPEVVGDTGILVDGTKYEECANAIDSVYKESIDVQSLVQRAYDKSTEYKWNLSAQNTLNVLTEAWNRFYSK